MWGFGLRYTVIEVLTPFGSPLFSNIVVVAEIVLDSCLCGALAEARLNVKPISDWLLSNTLQVSKMRQALAHLSGVSVCFRTACADEDVQCRVVSPPEASLVLGVPNVGIEQDAIQPNSLRLREDFALLPLIETGCLKIDPSKPVDWRDGESTGDRPHIWDKVNASPIVDFSVDLDFVFFTHCS